MKKLFSKCISIILAVGVSMTMLCTTAFAADTPSAWAQASVDTATSWGLLPDGMQERYQDNITREEFAEVLEKICNHYSGGKNTYVFWDNYERVEGNPFTDTDNWSVKQMYCAGIMSGIGDGKFGPDMSLTREQAATMIANLFDFCDKPLTAAAPTFSDAGQISSWAADGVGKVAAAGIMNGMGNNQFAPQGTYTREQSIVTALKTYELLIASNQPSTPSSNGFYAEWPSVPDFGALTGATLAKTEQVTADITKYYYPLTSFEPDDMEDYRHQLQDVNRFQYSHSYQDSTDIAQTIVFSKNKITVTITIKQESAVDFYFVVTVMRDPF